MTLAPASAVRRALFVATLLAASSSPAFAQEGTPAKPLLETLVEMGDYSALIAALNKAGLTEELKGAGPYTIYAPSNSAFERIPADTLAALTADPARFKRVIAHHVLPTKTTGIDMMNMPIYTRVPTQAGDSMTVYHDKGGIKVDLSLVKTVDVVATNGVIHTVHKVILVK
ncbi:MAG TPA: fasciclin domain-containing protein [Gemmatimonadales bacterium]|nr:fasciclin domain-containing protein [Gemmatimonadales bacterium]